MPQREDILIDSRYSKECPVCLEIFYKNYYDSVLTWENKRETCSRPCATKLQWQRGKVDTPFVVGRIPPHKGRKKYPTPCAICSTIFGNNSKGTKTTCGARKCMIAYRAVKNAKIAKARRREWKTGKRTMSYRSFAIPRPSSYEVALYRFLKCSGFKFVKQQPFPPYVVDAYVPKYKLVFEADGPWHDKDRDRLRDRRIRKQGAAAVIRLDRTDIMRLKKAS